MTQGLEPRFCMLRGGEREGDPFSYQGQLLFPPPQGTVLKEGSKTFFKAIGNQQQRGKALAALGPTDLGPAENFLKVSLSSVEKPTWNRFALQLQASGIPVETLFRRWSVDPIAWFRLKNRMHTLQPQTLHTWGKEAASFVCSLGVYSLGQGTLKNINWIASLAMREFKTERELRRLAGRLHQAGATLVTDSACLTERLLASGIVATTIPLGVPVVVPVSTATRETVLTRLRLPTDVKLFGTVVRLTSESGMKELIWAADLVRVLHPESRFVILGDGINRRMIERFGKLASNLETIRFFGTRNDVAQILPCLDVYWQGRSLLGPSVAMLEAMAAGVPVLSVDGVGSRLILTPEKNGYLAEYASRADWARITDHLFNEPALAKKIGAAGCQTLERDFSPTKMLAAYAKIMSAP